MFVVATFLPLDESTLCRRLLSEKHRKARIVLYPQILPLDPMLGEINAPHNIFFNFNFNPKETEGGRRKSDQETWPSCRKVENWNDIVRCEDKHVRTDKKWGLGENDKKATDLGRNYFR
jgi:hypothetical protein